jgi:predicted Holliday junction resolvase-like endonuclease
MKRYLISSAVTFFSAFALYFVTVIDTVTLEGLTDGALVSLIFVGVRAGLKALLEMFIVQTVTKETTAQ